MVMKQRARGMAQSLPTAALICEAFPKWDTFIPPGTRTRTIRGTTMIKAVPARLSLQRGQRPLPIAAMNLR
jgi:hypothetical protein